MARKSMGKSKRFEIFKRDNFKCLYCGATPAQKVLRVDHVMPVAQGGGNEPTNLVTSCFDCNSGKAARPMDEKRFATGFATPADKEHAEQIRLWLEIQRGIDAARKDVANEYTGYWEEKLGPISKEMSDRFPKLAREWSAEQLAQAISITAAKIGLPHNEEYDYRHAVKQQKYFHGILRSWRSESDPKPPPPPPPQRPKPEPPKRSPRAERIMRHMVEWQKVTPGQNIEDVFEEFTKAAWGSPEEIENSRYYSSSHYATHCVRGLKIETEEKGEGLVSWWVADDSQESLAREIVAAIESAFNDVECVDPKRLGLRPISSEAEGEEPFIKAMEAEALRDDWKAARSEIKAGILKTSQCIWESREFAGYLRTGNDTNLRACRETIGWSSPQWMGA